VPGSFRVARILGIDIRVHISWLLIFFLVLLSLADQVFPASYPQWSQQKTFIISAIAAFLFFTAVLLHELAHAIFDMLKIPIFGREEDAADQLAAFILLQFGNDVARRTITGAALLFHQMGLDQPPGAADYASVHGLPRQRFVNVLCIAYGAEPKLFADFVEKGHLPPHRRPYCRWEYRQIEHAFKTLISPHVDRELQEKVRGRQWLRPDDGKQ
jgi:hypothetical protein